MECKIAALQSSLIHVISDRLSSEQLARLKKVKTCLNPKLRTTIGRACIRENWIELNPQLLKQFPEELEVTFAHELAHIVAPMIYGRKGLGHQIGWKLVMKQFGYPPERTHRLNVGHLLRRHRVVALATCGCDGYEHQIKPRTYKKMTARRVVYKCVRCRKPLRLARNPTRNSRNKVAV